MIEVRRNSITIRDVDFKSVSWKKFIGKFSMWDPVAHKYETPIYYTIGSDVFIPSTVGETVVEQLFPQKHVVKNDRVKKGHTISFKMTSSPRDDVQKAAIKFMNNIHSEGMKHRYLSLPTGVGKTFVTINTISVIRKKAIIIVDRTQLSEQWKREFLTHTNISEGDIRILSGKASVEKEMAREDKGEVYIAMHQTICSLISDNPLFISKMIDTLGIGIKIFDEAHVNFTNMCNINSLSNTEYVLYLSATPARSNFKDNKLYSLVFKSVPSFSGADLAHTKYHIVVVSEFESSPTEFDVSRTTTQYGFNVARWSSFIEKSRYRELSDHIIELMVKLKIVSSSRKVAIILPTISLVEKISRDLTEYFGDIVGVFIGSTPKKNRDGELAKDIIVTNDKMLDKAIDIEGLEVVINASQTSSTVKLEQCIGRLRYRDGRSPIYIDIADIGFPQCRNQLKKRRTFYRKNAKKIINIES